MTTPGKRGESSSTFHMAEQAQRRALEAASQETPSNDNHALEELRQLIVAPEQQGIAEIRDRIDNLERRAEDVSSVVAEAIQMRREQGDDQALANALGPTIEATLRDSVRERPHVIADALFPVMGPAIRKSITETLRSMLESFNEALEHSLSWRGIKWRIEAIQTGKPFAEIVLMHSLVYRVEEVFLIHRKTGLVLSHVAAADVLPMDADMVAGMLSALDQFAQETFRSNESLDMFRVGTKPTWVEVGPQAIIAAVFRGDAPSKFRVRIQSVLEKIHEQFGVALERFEGDTSPFRAAEDFLMPLLEKGMKQEQAGTKKKPYAVMTVAGVAAAALLAWGAYISYRIFEWSRFEKALRQESGIAITSFEREGGSYHIRGFRDPLAADPKTLLEHAGLDARKADIQLTPFYSADDKMVAYRARKMLQAPQDVKLSVKDGVLTAEGEAPQRFIDRIKDRGLWIAGVHELNLIRLENTDAVTVKHDKDALEKLVLLFPLGRSELEAGQEGNFEKAKGDIAALLNHAERAKQTVKIEVVGHTDTTGVEAANLPLSQQRAERILRALERAGVKSSTFRPIGVGTSEPLRTENNEEGRKLNRSVTFRVSVSGPPESASAVN